MRRMAQLALPKRPITHQWRNLSNLRNFAFYRQTDSTKVNTIRLEIKHLQSTISETTQLLNVYNFSKTPQEQDMLRKDIVTAELQKIQYKKMLSQSFFELIKLVRASTLTLLPEDLVGSPFEGKDIQSLSKSDLTNLQAWSCRQLINCGGANQDVFETFATCIEQGAIIEIQDLEESSRCLIDIDFISGLRKDLVAQLREKAQSFKTKNTP